MSGTSQFIRRWGLFVADLAGGAGIALADGTDEPGQETLHVRFEVHQADAQQLANYAVIRIWNPPEDVVGKLRQYTRIVLQAGYRDGKYGMIFDGWITHYRYGHETPVDSYLELYASDGDLGITFATVNKTLMPAATTVHQQVTAALDSMGNLGVEGSDKLPAEGGPVNPRPVVLYGRASNVLENVRKTNGSLWSVQNGQLHVTQNDLVNAGEGVVLTSQSGLIGWPTVVPDGIEARCLLDPAIFVKERVKIDNASINRVVGTGLGTDGDRFQAVYPSPAAGLQLFAPTSTDGSYVAYAVEHRGDTRGNDWYTDLVLWAIDSKTGLTLTQDGQVPTNATIGSEENASLTETVKNFVAAGGT